MYNTLVSASELATHLISPEWLIVDCRFNLADTDAGRRAYAEGHIPGAIYAHLDEDLSGPVVPGETSRHPLPEAEVLAERFSRWGIRPEVQVVAYDDKGGAIAARLWWMLQWLGHEAAAVLDGGWQAWLAEGQPVNHRIQVLPPAKFIPRPRPEALVDAAFVLKAIDYAEVPLVDSRAAERYRGAHEPIDPVAGHIPSAVNLPFAENLDADGKMLPPGALKARFEAALKDDKAAPPVFYCGSGVTACHNVLAYRHAGLGEARLYAGSWSEWITDPQRPVE